MNLVLSPRFAALLCSLCLFLSCASARAQVGSRSRREDPAQTSGLALAIGLGTQTVYVGGQLLYYLQLPRPEWRVAFHVGSGGLPIPGEIGHYWGVSGGVFAAYGRRHRLVIGIEADTLDWNTLQLHGADVAVRQRPGAGLSLGWEYMTRSGVFVRGSVGPAFVVTPETPLAPREVRPWIVGGWQLGYKLW